MCLKDNSLLRFCFHNKNYHRNVVTFGWLIFKCPQYEESDTNKFDRKDLKSILDLPGNLIYIYLNVFQSIYFVFQNIF